MAVEQNPIVENHHHHQPAPQYWHQLNLLRPQLSVSANQSPPSGCRLHLIFNIIVLQTFVYTLSLLIPDYL